MFTNHSENIHKLQSGILLLSEPFLPDPNFSRTVILITEHNPLGSIGFVLNQPTKVSLNEAIENFPKFDATIYLGGPVETNSLHFLHTLGNEIEFSIPICEGVYWGGDFETVKEKILLGKIKSNQIRFFAGYSGWTINQLNDEMEQKSWIISPAKKEYIMSDEDHLWRKILANMGDKYRMISNYPIDPQLN